ncbi:MAG: TIGR00730 family Rossman fold protein [Patescibacteria group bacterium]
MKNVAVFCSAQEVDKKYVKAAREFARLLVKRGYHLVWGGTDTGLMKVIADEVQKGGGKLYGSTIETYHHLARKNQDELILARTLGERKAYFLEKSAAVVCLVGGFGTLDEITEIIELKKQGHHSKPIVILNTEGFYEGLKVQLQRMKDEGFLKSKISKLTLEDIVYFADTPEEAINFINKALK